jgi:threonine aldolase
LVMRAGPAPPGGGGGPAQHGVLCSAVGPRRVRLITHLDIDDDGLDHAISVLVSALR